jgi:hypothetical protein
LGTLKTLKNLITFTAEQSENNATQDQLKKLLSFHFGYNLIFDDDTIINNSRMAIIKSGMLITANSVTVEQNNLLNLAENTSKTQYNRVILLPDYSSDKNAIFIAYTIKNSPNTFILSFPLSTLWGHGFQLLSNNNASLKVLPLTETNKLISEDFFLKTLFFI